MQSAAEGALTTTATARRACLRASTYLFQLAAHDLANTHITLAGGLSGNGPVNLRRRPLSLQTVLGEGARGCPFAYHVVDKRLQLRTGQVRTARPEGGWDWTPPARDLPRIRHDTGVGGAEKAPMTSC
jgi:hypothetical protein